MADTAANEHEGESLSSSASAPMPRDNLIRALQPGLELRWADESEMPTLLGHFAVFDQWTEIDSMFEGRFMERISPGAFRKTFKENRERMRPLFQHGHDPQVGQKVLGPIAELREDDAGAYYEVPLLDTSYNRDLLPGLKAGLYGSSFRFRVTKVKDVDDPGRSAYNPDGLPERTIKEMQVFEFGPVTFPAYAGASAGIRSLTDAFAQGGVVAGERERIVIGDRGSEVVVVKLDGKEIAEAVTSASNASDDERDEQDRSTQDGSLGEQTGAEEAHSGGGAEEAHSAALPESEPVEGHSEVGSRDRQTDDEETTTVSTVGEFRDQTEIEDRLSVIKERLQEIDAEFGINPLPEDEDKEFRGLVAERDDLKQQLAAWADRQARLREYADDDGKVESEQADRTRARTRSGSNLPDNLHDLEEYRTRARSAVELKQLYRDGAMKLAERMVFPHQRAEDAKVKAHIEKLLAKDQIAKGDHASQIAQRVIATGSPAYERAFWKALTNQPMATDERQAVERAMSLTDNAGGFAVPIALDPTVIPTSDGAINPIRQIARVETITGDVWQGVSSDGVVASRANEAAQATDDAPAFAGPSITPSRVHCWIPFSYEIGMDFSNLQAELARMLSDAKDVEEAGSFITGDGNPPNPEGVVSGLALWTHVLSGTVNGFEVADLYALKAALPPRFRGRAAFLANDSFYGEIRQLDTSGGASLWTQLGEDTPDRLLGKPAYESSDMAATSVSGDEVLLYGDFSYYCIVDRVGMSIELVPQVFGANQRPTGQRGVYAFWRNGAEILSDNAFRVLTIGLTS